MIQEISLWLYRVFKTTDNLKKGIFIYLFGSIIATIKIIIKLVSEKIVKKIKIVNKQALNNLHSKNKFDYRTDFNKELFNTSF